MKQKNIAILMVAVLSAGCANTNISKEMQLTAGGVAAGAIAGAQVDGVRGAVIGGIIGGVIGNRIGSYLDAEDEKKLAKLEMQSLQSGRPTSFVSKKSNAEVTVTPQQTRVEANTDRTFNLPPDIVKQRLEVAAHDDVNAFVDTPVYRDTKENSAPRQIIQKGEKIRVSANVINKKWGAVVDGNNVLGYVPLRYLNKSIQKQPKKSVAKAAVPKPAKNAEIATAKDSKSSTGSSILPAIFSSPQPGSTTVQATWACKVNLIRVKLTDGKTMTEERKYCKEPPKGWKVVMLTAQLNAYA